MTDMIERVARAILADHDWTQNPVSDEDGMQVNPEITGWDALSPDWQECLRGMARAAIKSMRTPTDDMKIAGFDSIWGSVSAMPDGPIEIQTDAAAVAWRYMIDAALAPSPTI